MTWNKEDYTAKIALSGGLRLTIITYEIALYRIEQAEQALSPDHETHTNFETFIHKARTAVEHLIDTLDMSYAISKDLYGLYVYINKLLVSAVFRRKSEHLQEAHGILETLLESWKVLDKNHKDEDAVQVFAGLTYKDGKLAEYIEDAAHKGYQA